MLKDELKNQQHSCWSLKMFTPLFVKKCKLKKKERFFKRYRNSMKTIDPSIFSSIRIDVFICCAVVRYLWGYSLASSTSCLCSSPSVLTLKVYLNVYAQRRLLRSSLYCLILSKLTVATSSCNWVIDNLR